jgi:hypothetical protein
LLFFDFKKKAPSLFLEKDPLVLKIVDNFEDGLRKGTKRNQNKVQPFFDLSKKVKKVKVSLTKHFDLSQRGGGSTYHGKN